MCHRGVAISPGFDVRDLVQSSPGDKLAFSQCSVGEVLWSYVCVCVCVCVYVCVYVYVCVCAFLRVIGTNSSKLAVGS